MNRPWTAAADSIEANIASVMRLLTFDRDIVAAAVGVLDFVAKQLEAKNMHSLVTPVANRSAMLTNLANNESLKPQYDAMFNQCVVLLVSYFGSGIHRMFLVSTVTGLHSQDPLPVHNEALTVTWRTLETADSDRESAFADLLVAQKDISFQDMKSIGRAFEDLLGVAVERDGAIDNIILGQAARHAIVHAGATVDQRMIRQLSGVKKRTLKTDLQPGQQLKFTPEEIAQLAASMRAYVASLTAALERRFPEEARVTV